MKFYKWSGAGNLFVIADGRAKGSAESFAEVFCEGPARGGSGTNGYCRPSDSAVIQRICKEYGTDGLMILRDSPAGHDFAMEFYNPDGSGGMMCGNGGRCIAAFADSLGIKPGGGFPAGAGNDGKGAGKSYVFDAPDGVHTAEILQRPGEGKGFPVKPGMAGDTVNEWTVRLRMKDVDGVTEFPDGLFLNTGTRHFVKFVPVVDAIDIEREALPIRHDPRFAPEGTNVNFVEIGSPAGKTSPEDICEGRDDRGKSGRCGRASIRIRTFEKGVEGETAACGTGITAAALACRCKGIAPNGGSRDADSRICYRIRAREATLGVDFLQTAADSFSEVFLTGPARQL